MTDSRLYRGLENVPVAETRLSHIDGETGELVIGGYPVADLATNATYEEALYLLFEDRLPTTSELADVRSDLAARREVGDEVRAVLRRAAETGRSAMDALRMGLAAADLDSPGSDPRDAALRAVAVAPTVVATYWRYRRGEEPLAPREDLGHAANYLFVLTGEEPAEAATRALETYLCTMVDHGLNASTFTARVVASTEADPVSAATAAVGALKGPRHGDLAAVLDLLEGVHGAEDPADVVREWLTDRERAPGFGHPVYRGRDPRVAVLSAAAERFYGTSGEADFLASVRTAEEATRELLAERTAGRTPATNAEFYAAALLRGIGIPRALLSATFAVARVGGWMAHCLEGLGDDRLVRPVSRYVGATGRTWTPVEDRDVGDGIDPPVESGTLDPVSETLATLSDPNRLAIVLALSDRAEPVAYSTLRSATGIEDKGRFNYHLRQLRGELVADREDGYVLTDAGRAVVDAVGRGLLDGWPDRATHTEE